MLNMYIYCIYHNMIGLSDYELFRLIKYRKPISNVNKQVKQDWGTKYKKKYR